MPSILQLNENGILFQCVENSNDAVMLTDRDGALLYVNQSWIRIFGFSKEEAVGKTPKILRSTHQSNDFYERMWSDLLDSKKGFWKGEIVNRTKDGKEIPMLLTITSFNGPNQDASGYMGMAIDLTEKKRHELEIIRKDRLASIGVLAAGLAHETGTPLATVRGRAEHALSKAPSDSPIRKDLNIIIGEVDRISELMWSLLSLSVERDKEESKVALVHEILEDVYNLMRDKIESNKITFKMQLGPDTKVSAPTDHLGQVILNLFTNSMQAIEKSITEGRTEGHNIHVERKDRGNDWELCIRDSGCGIPEKEIPHLFRPFFTTKDIGEGKGLGLSIAHQLVQSWGGSIHIESKTNRGTAVSIVLPKANG